MGICEYRYSIYYIMVFILKRLFLKGYLLKCRFCCEFMVLFFEGVVKGMKGCGFNRVLYTYVF